MTLLRYEHRRQRPLTRRQFAVRMLRHGGIASVLVGASLVVGTAGYICFAHQGILDAFLNASMLLGGMGPVNAPVTEGGKLFAGFFALYAGLLFIATAALLFTPLLHRLMHRFHWDEK